MKSEQINELATALSKAQSEIQPAKMNATNPFLKNRYADLGSVIEAAREPLAKHGLSISQPVSGDDEKITVSTLLMHTSGQWLESTVSMTMGEERGKSAAQVAGSIITYLRRYSLASMLGIYADEDTDGNGSQDKSQKKAPAPKVEEDAPGLRLQPAKLKDMLAKKAATYGDKTASGGQRGLMVGMLDLVLQDDSKRHNVCVYLFGSGSSKEISDAQVLAALDWLDAKKDSGGAYQPSEMAAREISAVYNAAITENQPSLV